MLKLLRSTGSSQSQDENLVVKEILLTGLPDKNPKPLLAALVDQDLLLYEAFSYNESSTEGHLNVRFKKVSFTASWRAGAYLVDTILFGEGWVGDPVQTFPFTNGINIVEQQFPINLPHTPLLGPPLPKSVHTKVSNSLSAPLLSALLFSSPKPTNKRPPLLWKESESHVSKKRENIFVLPLASTQRVGERKEEQDETENFNFRTRWEFM